MKIFRSLLIVALSVLTLAACQKDESDKGIKGTWTGKWGFDTDAPSYFEKWELKKNGELIAYKTNGDVYAEGTWELDGISFECEYTTTSSNNHYSFFGLYHDVLEEIIGTWGETPSTTDGGNFEMYKN